MAVNPVRRGMLFDFDRRTPVSYLHLYYGRNLPIEQYDRI